MEPAIKMAEQKLDILSSDPITIELYKAREYSEHERANIYSSGIDIGLKQGIELGQKQGIELGQKQGIELGQKQGIELGQKQGKLQSAIALLDILDDNTISTKLDISIEDVKKLREDKTISENIK